MSASSAERPDDFSNDHSDSDNRYEWADDMCLRQFLGMEMLRQRYETEGPLCQKYKRPAIQAAKTVLRDLREEFLRAAATREERQWDRFVALVELHDRYARGELDEFANGY
ncbi:MAG TPA: hypothetical protein VHC98_00045 [Candidatus Saccharimonadales bacterium]|nr:hypothetical protein [Candidatus Saccharimonadales bacterium]